MAFHVHFIERKPSDSVSLERVFEQVGKSLRESGVEVTFQKLPFGNGLLGIFLNLVFFRKPQADIYHVTGHCHYIAFRLPATNTVLTVHDLNILKSRRGIRRIMIKKLFFDWPVRRLKNITAISAATKSEMLRSTGCDWRRVTVISNPLPDEFIAAPKTPVPDKPVVLIVGTAQHKNLSRVARAIAGMQARMTVVGKLSGSQKAELEQLGVDFENFAFVEPGGMPELYRRSTMLSFCSTQEGFGLPIIEAQAMERPVLTSNISPMKEVAGDGARLVDPLDLESIRRGFLDLLSNSVLRAELVEKGRRNVERFAPESIARAYIKLYKHVLDRGRAERIGTSGSKAL
jgi:glycosyltransferase involved in cell wall biosynthesis